jgi:hypothetical protein
VRHSGELPKASLPVFSAPLRMTATGRTAPVSVEVDLDLSGGRQDSTLRPLVRLSTCLRLQLCAR